MSNRPVLFDSFGSLLVLYRQGKYTGDRPNFVYHFGTMLRSVTGPDARYAQSYHVTPEDILKVLGWLAAAEADGRLFWRETTSIYSQEELGRFQNTLAALRRLGADIPEYINSRTHPSAYWNVPAMREFLGGSVEFANPI